MLNGTLNKFVGALLAGAIGFATTVVNSKSSSITASEWIGGATYLVIATQTYLLKNAPPTPPAG